MKWAFYITSKINLFLQFYALWNALFYKKVPRSWKKYFFDINNGLYFVSVPCT